MGNIKKTTSTAESVSSKESWHRLRVGASVFKFYKVPRTFHIFSEGKGAKHLPFPEPIVDINIIETEKKVQFVLRRILSLTEQ